MTTNNQAAVNAYSVACPDCGAAPGEYCAIYVEDAGFVPHRARYLLARRETAAQTGIPEAALDRMAVRTW